MNLYFRGRDFAINRLKSCIDWGSHVGCPLTFVVSQRILVQMKEHEYDDDIDLAVCAEDSCVDHATVALARKHDQVTMATTDLMHVVLDDVDNEKFLQQRYVVTNTNQIS